MKKNSLFFTRNSKGQVAIEFFVYSALFLLVVMVSYVLVNFIQDTEIPEKEGLLIRETGQSFVDAVSLAVGGGPGFTYNLSFSKTVLGGPYRITIYDSPPGSNLFNLLIESNLSSSEYSSIYSLPSYEYKFEGGWEALGGSAYAFNSNESKTVLTLENDGENLTLIQRRS